MKERMKNLLFNKVFLTLIIGILSLFVRLYDISEPAPQADEMHWMNRSNRVVENYRARNFTHLTTHLSHPGVPPAFVMALGQMAAEKYNLKSGYTLGDKGYVDKLSAARMFAAIVSSLVVPLLFFAAASVGGIPIGLLASLFLLFDPMHVGFSRWAHLDATLVFLASLSVWLYYLSVERESLKLKLLAGFFWGLAVCTKPTALSLLGVFLLYRIARRFLGATSGDVRVLAWSDVWATVIGLTAVGSIYTRLWHHFPTDFRKFKLNARLELKDSIYSLGSYLNSQLFFVALASVVLVFLIIFSFKRYQRFYQDSYFHVSMALGLTLYFLLTLTFFPQVYENFIGFFHWTKNLPGEKHVSWGKEWRPDRLGYLMHFFERQPSLVSVLFVTAIPLLIFKVKSFSFESKKLIILSALVLILWIGPISLSSKQAHRYAIPAVPFLYLFISTVWLSFLSSIRRGKILISVFSFFCIASQAYAAHKAYPHYDMFVSRISGGVSAMLERDRPLSFAGQNEALRFLHAKAVERNEKLVIGLRGDGTALKFTYDRLFPKDPDLLVLQGAISPVFVDYLVFMGGMENELQHAYDRFPGIKEVFSKQFDNHPVLTVLETPYQDFEEEFHFDIGRLLSKTGRRKWVKGTQVFEDKATAREQKAKVGIVAIPKVHARGWLLFGHNVRVKEGAYAVRFHVGIPQLDELHKQIPKNTPVVTVEAGGNCKREISLNEISSAQVRPFDIECSFSENSKTQVRVLWHGVSPVLIEGLSIRATR